MTSAAKLRALFIALDYLDQISVDEINRWSAKDRKAAERWAYAWDGFVNDISDHPLPEPPAVLRPYLPVDFRQ